MCMNPTALKNHTGGFASQTLLILFPKAYHILLGDQLSRREIECLLWYTCVTVPVCRLWMYYSIMGLACWIRVWDTRAWFSSAESVAVFQTGNKANNRKRVAVSFRLLWALQSRAKLNINKPEASSIHYWHSVLYCGCPVSCFQLLPQWCKM